MKGVTANKTDKDEPEVRRSSRLAEKSPVSFENLFLSPEQLYNELFSHRTSVHASCYYMVGWPDAGQAATLQGIGLNLTLAYDKKNNCTYLLFLSARHFIPF